jgi:hypothetical protein
MHKAPTLCRGDLDELIALVGGDAAALKLLDMDARTLRRWRAGQKIPSQALKLLWYAGPQGRQAADADLYNEVRTLRVLANALDRQGKISTEAERFLASLRQHRPQEVEDGGSTDAVAPTPD